MARFHEMQIVSSGAMYAHSANDYNETLLSVNSSSVNFAAFFMAVEAMTITHLGVSYNLRTGTPPTQRVSLREPSSDGLFEATPIASKTFTPPADSSWDGTFQWHELVNPYPATRGQKLVMVLEYMSGAVSNSNRSRYFTSIGNSRLISGHYPFHVTNNGSLVKSGNAPIFGYKTSTRSYGLPLIGVSDEQINNPGEAGLRFLLDRGFGSTYRLLGASFMGRLATTSGQSVDLVLYNAAGDTMQRVTRDADHPPSLSGDLVHDIYFDDATLEELQFGQEYFLVLAPSGASTNTQLKTFDLGDSADMTALRGGSGMYLVTRASTAAAFTRERDRRPLFCDLFIDAWSA